MDKRTRHYRLQRKVRTQWLIVLAVLIAVVYISQPVQTPVSPCPESGCVVITIPKVEAAEPVLETYNAPQHIVDLIIKYFGDEAQNALKIVGTCENGKWNPTAVNPNRNGSWDAGIFQINSVHGYSQEYLFNPENNIKAAKKIFNSRGWTSWACSEVLGIKPFWK